jgi:3-oxoacyl-[acyl-carrier-protein] synthase II
MRRVAITGFGIVSPIGCSKEAFWNSLKEGSSGISRITRFDCNTFDAQLAGEVKELLPLPEEIAVFSNEDIKIGFAYAACKDALKDAGMESIKQEMLLHMGTSVEFFNLERLVYEGKVDITKAAGAASQNKCLFKMPLDTSERLICRSLGMPKRALTNVSACAAGAQAIGHGFRTIRNGSFDIALCGGFDSMINPLGVGGFQLLGALTTENNRGQFACRPFDASRSGTVLGEGAAFIVMETLEKAKSEGKRILAEICGYGSTLDAYSLSAPDADGDGASRSMTTALDDAHIEPQDVSHINTHGTGTRLNDEIEARAIRRVFERCWKKIPVSSTKSVTGHLIGAAGAVEVGACLLALVEGTLPPNPCLEKVGQGCELNHVVASDEKLEGEYVLSNSFGFGGQNATLILRKYYG